jgi:hypothetical protein
MILLSAVLALWLAPAAPAPTAAPEAVVKDVYTQHFGHQQRFDLTAKQSRARFAPALLALLDADDRAASANKDEVVGLDFDPLTNAQEAADAFTVGAPTVTGATASVPVDLKTGADKTRVTVRLASSGGAWQIADLDYGETTLVKTLKQLAKDRGGK